MISQQRPCECSGVGAIRSVTSAFAIVVLVSASALAQIRPVDLGTLGGEASFAVAVNDRGDVAGSSQVGDGSYHAFLWTATRGMVDLGTLGGAESFAVAINTSGRIVGESDTADATRHAFSWTSEEGMIDVPTDGDSHAVGVTRNGQVLVRTDFFGAYSWTSNGGLIDLGSLGDGYTNPVAINDQGEVVGVSGLNSSCLGCPDPDDHHAFSWTAERGMIDLGTLSGGFNSSAMAVTSDGRIAGTSETGETPEETFLWTPAGGMIDLGALGLPTAMNGKGQIVGDAFDSEGGAGAWSWTAAHGRVELGTFFGKTSEAMAVSSTGQVVGWAHFGRGEELDGIHGFSWTSVGGMLDLRPLGGGNSVANAVNAKGLVVGAAAVAARAGRAMHAALWHVAAETTPPLGDAYVRAGAFASANFGREKTLLAKKGISDSNTTRTYLTFDISHLTDRDTVTLRLHGDAPNAAGPVRTTVYAVRDTSWGEQTVTWTTRPALGAVLGTVTVVGATPQWVQLDLTSYVRAERRAGRKVISLALRNVDHTSSPSQFQSREAGSTGPRLVITR